MTILPELPKVSYKGYIEGFRWAGIENFLKSTAWNFSLDLEIEVLNHFLSQKVLYKVSGTQENIKSFRHTVEITIDAMIEKRKQTIDDSLSKK